jgi:hypothetical protein
MTSDTDGGFVHSVGATEGANEKTVAAFGRFHRASLSRTQLAEADATLAR